MSTLLLDGKTWHRCNEQIAPHWKLWTDNVANRKITKVFYPTRHCEILITLQ